MKIERPKRLFRYFPPEGADIFSTNRFWLSRATEFNDPFDVYPRFDRLTERIADRALEMAFSFTHPSQGNYRQFKTHFSPKVTEIKHHHSNIAPLSFHEEFSEKFGIVCFCTENLGSLMMWGHYAKCHTGFAVEFDPNHSMFDDKDFCEVIYSHERPAAENFNPSEIILTKSPEWKYESEFRLIKNLDGIKKAFRGKEKVERHYLELLPDAVLAVYFGCKIDAEIRNGMLMDLQKEQWRKIKCYDMRRHVSQYALEQIPLY